jgi:hypothetical protein
VASNQYESSAIEALRAWHSVAAAEFPQNMQLSFDEFLAYVRQRGPNWLLDFGKDVVGTANLSGVGMSRVIKLMEDLARQTQGRVSQYPDGYPKLTEFEDALIGRSLQWDVSVISAVSKKIVVEGTQKVATIGALALGSYGLILAISAGVGLYMVVSSYRKAA